MTDEYTVYHYDNRDKQLGVLHDLQVCYRDWDVNKSEDLLTLHATDVIGKEDRLVIQGRAGDWLEYVVTSPQDDDAGVGTTIVAELSSTELGGHYIDEQRPTGGCAEMLAKAIDGTRWESDGSDISAEAVTQVWYHTNSLAVINRIAATFGGEVRYRYEVAGSKVTHRYVGIFKRLGTDKGRTFEYGRDLLGVTRECTPDPIYTRVYGYGSGVEATDAEGNATGGYTRKITFAELNGGKPYVESAEALQAWGIPDGHGGLMHNEGKVEFDDCKDPAELLRLTTEWAEAQYEPQWSYTVGVLALDGEPLEKGDDATVNDEAFTPPLTIRERVIRGHEDFLQAEEDEYTLGKVQPVVSDTLAEQEQVQQQLQQHAENLDVRTDQAQESADQAQNSADLAQEGVDDLNDRSFDWDKTTDIVDTQPSEWLQECMDRINEEMNNAKTYKFTSFDKGDIWANGPLTKDGKPTGSTSAAIALNGLGFRISSQVRGGEFVWTTFGTGAGFTANCINVGILRCGDNYLNLDTGEMRIAFTAKVGSGSQNFSSYVDSAASSAASSAESRAKTYADNAADAAERAANSHTDTALQDYIQEDAIGDYLTQKAVFNALTNNGQLKGIFMSSEGQLMINGDYLRTGIIEGQNELSLWNLNSGYFETVGHTTSGGQSHTMRCRLSNGTLDMRMDLTSIGSAGTYTSSGNANVHSFGLAAFTNLILSSPGSLGVGYSASGSSLSWTAAVRESEMGFLSGASSSGSTLTLNKSTASVKHGIITSITGAGSVTYSAPSASSDQVRLVASVEPAAYLESGVAIQVQDLCGDDELAEAAEAGRAIWVEDPDAGGLGAIVYTGTEWTGDVPRATDPETVTVAKTAYVDERADLLQAEIEAIAAEVGGTALQGQLRAARSALSAGGTDAMASATRALRG